MTRYIGRHGTGRVAKAVLVGAIPPLMLKTQANPGGLPLEVFDQLRAGVLADRAQFYKDLSAPFFGANRPGLEGLTGSPGGLLGAVDAVRLEGPGAPHGLFVTHRDQFHADLLAFIRS